MPLIPFEKQFAPGQRVLLMGCGGGFDVYAGLPLYEMLTDRGCHVIFANVSFSNLSASGADKANDITWIVNLAARDMAYFPERWFCEHLAKRGIETRVFAFARSGVAPLVASLRQVIIQERIDKVLLVDGGTDSLIFGDEPGVGSLVEDAVSVIAANAATNGDALLANIGFGVDHFDGVSHHSYLENAAKLMHSGGFLGAFSVQQEHPAESLFLSMVEYANQRQPLHKSIVCNSIASAMRGEFGNYQATSRTDGRELFINPLMAQYWTFRTSALVAMMNYADALSATRTAPEASNVIEKIRESTSTRKRQAIPL